MPEGDTIFRAARTLDRALAGQIVTKFETQLPLLARVDDDTPLAGRMVDRVESAGKWVRMYFSGDLILLTHMLMSGSWHIYRPGERWKRSRYHMRIAIHTGAFVAVAFNVPVAEFHTAASLSRRLQEKPLGPDILANDFDPAIIVAQLRSRPDLEVGSALLLQSLVSGIGNVFKSEILFLAGIEPFTPVAALSDADIERLVAISREQLAANVLTRSQTLTPSIGRRTTRSLDPNKKLWVYGRGGKPCRRCGGPILARKTGLDARLTYWCPRCQGGGQEK